MRKYLFSGHLFLISISLLMAAAANAQQDSIRIAAIPFAMAWQNQPIKFIPGKTAITIVAGEKTDMFRDPNVTYNTDNAPKLLFNPDEDFVLTAAIEHSFTSKWDGGAIVVIQDSLNWIKFCYEKDYTGSRRVVSVVTKNVSDDCNAVSLASNKVFYKIAKAGNVFTLYYSVNGLKWFLVRHLQMDTTKELKLGFLAQSPTGKNCTVRFSNITYRNVKIKDPYTGE